MNQKRSISAESLRVHLNVLKERHSVAGIALAIGLTPRSVHRLFTTTAFVHRSTAERIIAAAQGPVKEEQPEVLAPVPELMSDAEYAKTPEGHAFVTNCRLPRKYREPVTA